MGLIVLLLVSRYSVGMSGPVPGALSPSLHPSSGFFSMELCQCTVNVVIIVVVVVVVVVKAYWVGLTTFRPIPLFRSGYSVGMSGPVSGPGSPSPRQSSLFFGPELRKFVLVKVNVVVWWVRRGGGGGGGAFGAVARAMTTFFFARYQEMSAVLVGV